MIRELKSASHNLSDEQHVQAVIRSLTTSWEYVKVNMTHNESIKTIADIEHHFVLEDEHREAAKTSNQAFIVETARNSNAKQKGKSKKLWNKKSW